MNLEIANKLYKLRKKNGLSQEALAEKLGISRQSISKWERAESSPDTDNLISLAKLYNISLDELLLNDAKEIKDEQAQENSEDNDKSTKNDSSKSEPNQNTDSGEIPDVGHKFVNVNDGTNEGLKYTGKNIFTVQFHPEACPGPQDSGYLFDKFIEMMGGQK